ncbi:GuaB3 family IMP dehydrogenase-related protein [Rugosimonospora africana]|uniref:IMP dehydrogenase n=1 Tax=Rugosimonospora africana TaxID=556532 RepID=A0A8J3QN81_9ACTN|nr:GuaB3 family IMP dehydrogenase-related protein [Rugosimonospora africana]GIH12156.1 IMP dehydrogenase [Rugosimonospora africana]
MRDVVEIGLGKTAQRGYHLDDIAVVPSRRTRDVDDVSTSWQLDAYQFKIPCVAHPSDATMSPATAATLGQLGGLGVLNVEGLWTRYEDPTKILKELSALDDEAPATRRLQEVYAEPIRPDLIADRVRAIRDEGVTVAVRVSPQHTLALAPVILDAGVDILVIQGTLVSAEHVSVVDEPLNLKEFIADLDLPVIVGGCTNYQTALHLMRTGAAGVIVGVGADEWSTTDMVLGIRVPMATAIADAAAARRDYLDETGGRYVHLIADGDLQTSGDIAKALGCGADAVMLGEPLSVCAEAPAGGAWWHSAASHPSLPRGAFGSAGTPQGPMERLLFGPSDDPDGGLNLFGGLRRAMAKCGYRDLKEFQKVGLVLDR